MTDDTSNDFVTDFANAILSGEAPPLDLALLVQARAELEDWGYRLVTDPGDRPWDDHSYLRPAEAANPDIAANVRAMTEINRFVTYVVVHEDSEYIGYWRGGASRSISDSPVLVLDNEGQYELCGSTIAAALADHSGDEAFADWLRELGIRPGPDRTVEDDPNEERDTLYEKIRAELD